MTDDQALWFLNTRIAIRRASSEAADGLCIQEHWMPYGDSPPMHVHEREDEIFHLLEGVVRFRVGEEERIVRAGETVVGPKGVPHGFVVESPAGARCLVMTRGGDFEGFVREMGRPAATSGLPAPVEPTPSMQAALGQAAAAHRIVLVGPPLTVF